MLFEHFYLLYEKLNKQQRIQIHVTQILKIIHGITNDRKQLYSVELKRAFEICDSKRFTIQVKSILTSVSGTDRLIWKYFIAKCQLRNHEFPFLRVSHLDIWNGVRKPGMNFCWKICSEYSKEKSLNKVSIYTRWGVRLFIHLSTEYFSTEIHARPTLVVNIVTNIFATLIII